jgi:hypothetical protein
MPVNCHLLVPALFIEPLQGDEYRNLRSPALEALLCRAEIRAIQATHYYQWLGNAFGLEKLAVAPITLQADGIEPGKEYWLRADPVHLRIQRDEMFLFDSHAAPLQQQEANALCATLNQHFARDQLQFIPAAPDRWYIKLNREPALSTSMLDQASGNSIDALMPAGAESPLWRQRMNEVQMLLFEHQVNIARESRRELPINSVWFWGGGFMPQTISSDYTQVMSDEIFARGLAQTARVSAEPLPTNCLEFSLDDKNHNNKKLIIINMLHNIMVYGDVVKWRDAQEQLDADYFVPLLAALKSGAIDTLTIIDPKSYKPREFIITKNSLRKFWRRAKPLGTYA